MNPICILTKKLLEELYKFLFYSYKSRVFLFSGTARGNQKRISWIIPSSVSSKTSKYRQARDILIFIAYAVVTIR